MSDQNDVMGAYEYLYNTIFVPVFLDRLEKRGYAVRSHEEAQYLLALGQQLFDSVGEDVKEGVVKSASYIETDEANKLAAELAAVPSVRESVVTLIKAAKAAEPDEKDEKKEE